MQSLHTLVKSYKNNGLTYTFARSFENLAIRTPMIQQVYHYIAPHYYQSRYEIDKSWEQPIRLFKLVDVEPGRIVYFSGRNFTTGAKRRHAIGSVKQNDWDQYDRMLIDEILFPSLLRRLEDNCEWEETDLYNYTLKKINSGQSFWHGCSNIQELEGRCEYFDKLYENIKSEGYKTNFERKSKQSYINKFLNEVVVDLDRNGEPMFVDGRHRLAIAKVLDLDTIPVFVLVRHNEWMSQREEIYTSNKSKEHFDITEF